MILKTLTTVLGLLPTLLLAAPTSLSARQSSCTPTSYTISGLTINPTPPGQHVHFTFTSNFNAGSSAIVDAATGGSVCDATQASDVSFANEIPCSTGRANVEVDLRGALGSGKYQVIHSWRCDGRQWMSSTPVDMAGGDLAFQPQNVHQICGTPTCP